MTATRRIILVAVVVAAGLGSVWAVSQDPLGIIPGDPAAYRDRMVAILDGGVPYLDVPLEHLPVSVVPMAIAWVLGGAASQSAYVTVFALVMLAVVVLVVLVMDRLGTALDHPEAGIAWTVAALPLLPLVLFRNDPVSVLFFALSALALVRGRRVWRWAGVVGAFAKIWPAVIALAGWRNGRRRDSWLVVMAGAVALGWTLLPGFTAARNAVGIHAETLLGSMIGLMRTTGGDPTGVVLTTAAYLEVDWWVVALNAAIGLVVCGFGVVAVWSARRERPLMVGLGTLVAGVILTSQLFSLQFVLWLTPFFALVRRRATLGIGVALGALTTVLAWIWDVSLFGSPWFHAGFLVRSLLVIVAAALMAREAIRSD